MHQARTYFIRLFLLIRFMIGQFSELANSEVDEADQVTDRFAIGQLAELINDELDQADKWIKRIKYLSPQGNVSYNNRSVSCVSEVQVLDEDAKGERCGTLMENNGLVHSEHKNGYHSNLLENEEDGLTKLKIGSGKRTDFLPWEEYFMAVAKLAAMRSKDPATQVGCAIVNRENKVIGTGYNGFPTGISDDDLPWTKGSDNPLENKHTYVVHAEMNAIINKSMNNIEGCTMYTTLLPCNECAKMIIQSRLSEVVYLQDRPDIWNFQATRKMFKLAGIKCRQFKTDLDSIVIRFK